MPNLKPPQPQYARETTVPAERTQAEIRALLGRYGADQFATVERRTDAAVGFVMNDRTVRFTLPLPQPAAYEKNASGHRRGAESARSAHAQATRSAWRALLLSIRAKLETVASGITTFDEEFLPHFVCEDGQTVGQKVLPKFLAQPDRTGNLLPPARPAGG